jgi:signal transduction histidine kinase
MRRLYLQIYLAVLAALALFVLLAGIGFKLANFDRPGRGMNSVMVQLSTEIFPADANQTEAQARVERFHKALDADITVFNADGSVFASAGEPLLFPEADDLDEARRGDIWAHSSVGPSLYMPLPGERVVAARRASERAVFGRGARGLLSLLTMLTLVGIAVAIVAWPVARRITRRVESLQSSVQAFGLGDLSARSKVKGKDEVARLARSFNESADHIEALVQAQKSLLANASHELRSPLARIRMASELIEGGGEPKPEMMQELRRNVGELDELVDEILLASRLDAQASSPVDKDQWAELDLGGLLAEESARAGLSAQVQAVPMHGDARLLRRLIRNLIENALRYGGNDALEPKDRDISISVKKSGQAVQVSVCDRGPGVAESERTRIFEPFYRVSGASERSGGVGLGLSLVRQIAQMHEGAARCEPRQGGGTCFIVDFPI